MPVACLGVARETRSSAPHHFERRCFVCGASQELILAGPLAKTLSCPTKSVVWFRLRFFCPFERHLSFFLGLRSSGFLVTCSACAAESDLCHHDVHVCVVRDRPARRARDHDVTLKFPKSLGRASFFRPLPRVSGRVMHVSTLAFNLTVQAVGISIVISRRWLRAHLACSPGGLNVQGAHKAIYLGILNHLLGRAGSP